MKILIAAFSFSPQVNGIANVVYQHAKYFSQKGHQVTVVTGIDEKRDFEVVDNIQIQEFSVKGGPLLSNFYRGEVNKYIRFLQSAQAEFDAIFFHGWQIWVTDLVIFSKPWKRRVAKLIFVSHCAPSTQWNSIAQIGRSILLVPYIYFFMPLLMNKFDYLVFLSNKKSGDRHRDHKYAARWQKEKISTIPNGVPDVPSNLSPSPKISELYQSIQSKRILLFVANYGQGKNQKLAINVFEKLRTQSKAHLVLIGSTRNAYYDELMSVIHEKHLEHKVSVLSGLERSDVLWFYSKSYLTLFTSTTECSPLSVSESLAFAKPVVATDVGCLDEWVGVTVCNSSDHIISEVDALLDDESLYLEQKTAICTNAAVNSWDAVMRKYDKFLLV